ncbi:MAG: NAD(P)-dependent oxidoreductase [Bacilli bacterium]
MKLAIYECASDERAMFGELAEQYPIQTTLTDQPLSADTLHFATNCTSVSISHKGWIDAKLMKKLSDMGVERLVTRSVGFNHIDLNAAQTLGIEVHNVHYSPDSVADYTVMFMLMLTRMMKQAVLSTEKQDFTLQQERTKELRDLTVGVIGSGRIGGLVIARLQAFGSRVITYAKEETNGVENVTLERLLAESDIVTLHVPLTSETKHMLNEQTIRNMKRGAWIVNTGRGELIHNEALLEALVDGHIAGAALDVLDGEEAIFYQDFKREKLPNATIQQLCQLPNVIVTPHVAYYTTHALRDIVETTMDKCLQGKGEALCVN